MKIIVTHSSPDLDAITSAWLIKRFLPGWEDANIQFVPAGERVGGAFRLPHTKNDANNPFSQSTANIRSLSERRQKDGFNPGQEKKPPFSSFSDGQTSRSDAIEIISGNEVIHVDTGLGPLDHHQTADTNVCAASLTFDYLKRIKNSEFKIQNSKRVKDRMEAVGRMVKVVVDVDHFREVFWKDAASDYHEFSLIGILDGLKIQKPDQDEYY